MVGLQSGGREWEDQNTNEVTDWLVAAKITKMNRTQFYAQKIHSLVEETTFYTVSKQYDK